MDASDGSPPPFLEPLLGVVFDLDGTLILSNHDFRRMRREAIRLAEQAGVVPGHLHPEETIVEIVSSSLAELEGAGIPEGNRFRFEAAVNRTIDEIEMEALPKTAVRDGAVELLGTLTQRGFRLGVLTRSSSEFCRAALKRTGLIDYFPYLRTRSSPGPAKPDPEALRLLLHDMGVPYQPGTVRRRPPLRRGVRDPRERSVLRSPARGRRRGGSRRAVPGERRRRRRSQPAGARPVPRGRRGPGRVTDR